MLRFPILCSALSLAVAACAFADDQPQPEPTGEPAAEQKQVEPEPEPEAEKPAAESKGLLPIPEYGGDFWMRSFLTGDWGGKRTKLADKGIQFGADWNQTVQGVEHGGRDTAVEYGGSLDYILNLDLMRMGLLPGAMVKIRAESRYGNSVNGIAGPLIPVDLDAFLPISQSPDDDIPITVTDVTYYQFLSEKFALFAGKFDTLDGDPNEFASGRGNTQFLNSNFVFNSVLLMSVPYDTLGGGVIWMPSKNVTISSAICNTTDASTTTGFDDIGNGWTATIEADFQYRLGGYPGGQNVGFAYAWDEDFTQIGRYVFRPGEGISVSSKSDTWAAYWSAWQYVFTTDTTDAPVNLTDGRPDRKGIGLFGRAGYADDETNPVYANVSAGIGGRGVIPSRDDDTFGLGWYYTRLQTGRLASLAGVDDHAGGFEAFYNIAITPAAQLTLDIQVVESALPDRDRAIILGARLFLNF